MKAGSSKTRPPADPVVEGFLACGRHFFASLLGATATAFSRASKSTNLSHKNSACMT